MHARSVFFGVLDPKADWESGEAGRRRLRGKVWWVYGIGDVVIGS